MMNQRMKWSAAVAAGVVLLAQLAGGVATLQECGDPDAGDCCTAVGYTASDALSRGYAPQPSERRIDVVCGGRCGLGSHVDESQASDSQFILQHEPRETRTVYLSLP